MEQIRKNIEWIAKVGAVGFISLYAIGSIVINKHFAKFGIVDFSIFRVQFMLVGVSCILIFAWFQLPLLSFFLAVKSLRFAKVSWGIAMIIGLVVSIVAYIIISFLVQIWFFETEFTAILNPLQGFIQKYGIGFLWILVTQPLPYISWILYELISHLTKDFDDKTSKMASRYEADEKENDLENDVEVSKKGMEKELNDEGMLAIVKSILRNSGYNHLFKNSMMFLFVAVTAYALFSFIVWYGVALYPFIPQHLGGGEPITVDILLDSESHTRIGEVSSRVSASGEIFSAPLVYENASDIYLWLPRESDIASSQTDPRLDSEIVTIRIPKSAIIQMKYLWGSDYFSIFEH